MWRQQEASKTKAGSCNTSEPPPRGSKSQEGKCQEELDGATVRDMTAGSHLSPAGRALAVWTSREGAVNILLRNGYLLPISFCLYICSTTHIIYAFFLFLRFLWLKNVC